MKFHKALPIERLRPYIKYLVISEQLNEQTYKVFPSTSIVMGFQYKGKLLSVSDGIHTNLATAGITGISDVYKVFRNSPDIGTILVYFTETGLVHFTSCPAQELFNQSIAIDHIFNTNRIAETEERLGLSSSDEQRVRIVEQFFLLQLKETQEDKLIAKAVKLIFESRGTIRIKELTEKLYISQSPFEKRFRKTVGTSPKKFASITRFNSILSDLNPNKSIAEICYENKYFDQAHFIKDFKQFTGDTPENFKRHL